MIGKFLKFKDHEDVRYLLLHGKYKLMSSGVTIFLGFILSWYLANNTSKEFFGNYLFVISIFSMFALFSFPGFKDAITQSVARGYDYSLVQGFWKKTTYSLVGSLAFMLVATHYYLLKNDAILAIVFFVSAIVFPFYYSLEIFVSFLNAKKRFKTEAFYSTSVVLAKVILMVLSVIIFNENLILLFVVFFLSQMFPNLYYYVKCSKEVKSIRKDDDLAGYAKFLTWIKIIVHISSEINHVIIGVFIGPLALAQYFTGTMFVKRVVDLIKPMTSVFYPKLSDGSMKLTKKKLLLIIIASIVICLMVITILPLFIKILFPKYIDSIKYGLLFSLTLLFQPTIAILQFYFRALKKTRIMRNVTLIENASRLIVIVPLFLFFQIYGLISSVIITHFIGASIRTYYFLKKES
ncbi:MAG: oligosaccharide flippase family protein [archaeon]